MAAPRKPRPVPQELALLYEFVNSLDARRFLQGGVPHVAGDELGTVQALEAWMRHHGLLEIGAKLSRGDHEKAMELRGALRGVLRLAPSDRRAGADGARLNTAAANFSLIVEITEGYGVRLQPRRRSALSGLGAVLAELHHAAEIGNLDRLKMCASDECRWAFYDRSRPGTRRWCSSLLCGNREKTRAYRTRQRVRA
jgi:predicted RNA-binding Zn ribbon-like protein